MLAASVAVTAQPQTRQPTPPEKRIRYQISLALDFDNRTYVGTERVHWVNRGDHPTTTLFFHLYPNMRAPDYVPPTAKNDAGQLISDEPALEISEVRTVSNDAIVPFALDDQQTTLRINLREVGLPNSAVDIQIKFKGSVPEIDPEETGLVTHVLQQVSAAIRSTRERRRARDTNFVCRGVMMLATSFPILAARNGDDWFRKVESSIADSLTTDAADFEVTVSTGKGVMVFTPVEGSAMNNKDESAATRFVAENLRDFAIVAGRNLRSEGTRVGNVSIRSIFRPDHEVVGRSVLKIAAKALHIYESRFGPLPMKTVTIVDAPLVATLGSAEFAGVGAIASAFYVDFDSPTMRNMPDVIREQRASVEDSLEWTVAHVVAHQWWGAVVGNDAGREPILDESLSNWSALLYYRETHGEQQTENALEEQLRGVYKVYRTFGGDDMEASRSSRDYRNSFQFAAIVASKGALMFEALRKLLGDEKFFAALRDYYKANSLEVADLDDLRGAFIAGAPVEQRRAVSRTFDRWLSSKRGDEDIGPPDPRLAQELGLPARTDTKGDKTVFTPFAKLGKFFWQQMTKIR
ncbi:MAG TPA: M1 family aminopeptidase [Pyrinomonadaceae bacterium]|nr:M1 family aminopeptidase [Pyrinomonadaceae bacterium]